MTEPAAPTAPVSRSLLVRLVNAPGWLFVGSAIVLFACSAVRHELFHSSAYDLGWFDQAVYLISRGQPPIVSLVGYHVLGDHAALVLYLLAPLYLIWRTAAKSR